jgi:hypothetical protein
VLGIVTSIRFVGTTPCPQLHGLNQSVLTPQIQVPIGAVEVGTVITAEPEYPPPAAQLAGDKLVIVYVVEVEGLSEIL